MCLVIFPGIAGSCKYSLPFPTVTFMSYNPYIQAVKQGSHIFLTAIIHNKNISKIFPATTHHITDCNGVIIDWNNNQYII
jgi:hypothetical protein